MDKLTEAKTKFSEYVKAHSECIYSESIALARWVGAAKQSVPFTMEAADLQIAVTELEFQESNESK